jgi:hypothetical protein
MSEIQEAIEFYKLQNKKMEYETWKPCQIYPAYRANEIAIEALQEQAEREKENKPLTLEELRQMDGEPVWVVGKRELKAAINGWMLINTKSNYSEAMTSTKSCQFADYGKLWLAYARKPVSKWNGFF